MRRSLLALTFLLATAANAGKRPALPADVEAALANASADRPTAIARLESASRSAEGDERPWVFALLGEQLRLAGHGDEARAAFVQALTYGGNDVEPIARMGMALLDAARALDSTTVSTLVSAKDSAVLDSQNADRYTYLAERAAAGAGGDVSGHAKKALAFAKGDPAQLERVTARITAAQSGDAPRLPAPVATTTPTTAVKPTVVPPDRLLEQAIDAADRGAYDEARKIAYPLLESTDPVVMIKARVLLQSLDGGEVDATKVGVLLPSTGKYASIGEQIKDALLDGWGQVAPPESLVFADTTGSASGAVAALNRLVTEQHVIAVIGPLLTDETQPVVDAADKLGVPLIALSQGLEDPTPWPWVFQAWITPGQQIDALLDDAMDGRHMRDFAIYAPQSNYGKRAADLFSEQVTTRGGHIVVRVDYPEGTRTHGPVAAALRQPDPDPAVHARWYDAIFVPDKANQVTLAAAGIAYNEISIGASLVQDREPAVLLGLSGWNQHELAANGSVNLRGAMFTDVYVAPPTGTLVWSPLESWREFTARYHDTTGRNPSALEALASDAGRTVGGAFRLGATTRYGFREALLDIHPTSTVSGVSGFDEEHRMLQRRIAVISVTPTGFVPAGYE